MLIQLIRGGLTLEGAIIQILALMLVIFVVLPVHELAHAGVAYLMGDRAIKYRGRLTFNPLMHVDIFGSLCLLLFGFGWAKPVPVDDRNFKNPKVGMAITALAGPASNLICAFLAGSVLVLIMNFGTDILMSDAGFYLVFFLYYFLALNVTLAVFNLIPMPPLDGSKILFAFLPDKAVAFINNLQRYWFIIIYAIIIMIARSGALNAIDSFFMKLCLFNDQTSVFFATYLGFI